MKNVGGALCSPLRSMMFGKFFCDTSACRRWGMPPAVYRRSEPMSDSLHAAMFNPYYVLSSPDSHQISSGIVVFFEMFSISSCLKNFKKSEECFGLMMLDDAGNGGT